MRFKRLEELRKMHNMTQEDVAKKLNLKREVYRRYEKGLRALPVDCLIELAYLYDVSTDYILEIKRSKN